MGYILKQDLVIPSGTELHQAPSKTVYADKDGNPAGVSPAYWVEAVVAHGPDACSHWRIHIGDALEQGVIEEVAS